MNKNAIKKYAVWARRELIDRVSKKAMRYGIAPEIPADPEADSVDGRLLSDVEKKERRALIEKVAAHGYEQTMEEAAYTWFNRFAALRFMEVNGYLPSHVRVFTNDAGEFKPQILAEAIHLDLPGLDKEKVYALKEANDEEALFRYLIIVQCNALNEILPGMFQRLEDFTELLLPDNLLREGSVIERLISEIPEGDFNDINSVDDKDESHIEIIGWLYQYYISERHEEVVNIIGKKVVEKENVPAATQLFTTDWVVRYLIDNSVGRYWIERNPSSTLADKLTYLVKPKGGVIKNVNEKITPQELSVFDPCVGSGHFLVYAFDVLMKIYVEYGYTAREAAAEIVKHNLFGLDIDGRAAQLAYFAVMMKARQYDRRFFSRKIQPHVYEIVESNDADRSSIEHFCNGDSAIANDVKTILDTFQDAKEYGSILQVPIIEFGKINERFAQLADEASLYNTYLLGDFQKLMRVAEIMSGKYAVVATNPPYLNKFDSKLKAFIADNYNDYKGDLFSVFIYRNFGFCLKEGYSCLMTPMVWMFIQTYEKLRQYIIDNKRITTLIQFEYSAYEEATVPICTFVLQNYNSGKRGSYLRLVDFRGGMEVQRQKVLEAIETHDSKILFEENDEKFVNIPGLPIAYWASDVAFATFSNGKRLDEIVDLRHGMSTSDNDRFLRLWWEVSNDIVKYGARSKEESFEKKWFPILKGGTYKKWYGNFDYVVNWKNDGEEIKTVANIKYPYLKGNLGFVIGGQMYFFHQGITWSSISSGKAAFRYFPNGFLFTNKGQAFFCNNIDVSCRLMGFLNSIVSKSYLEMLAPTIGFEMGYVSKLPIKEYDEDEEKNIDVIVKENIKISKADWDAFETSWDFQSHPLAPTAYERREQLSYGIHSAERKKSVTLLADRYTYWEWDCNYRFSTLKKNEEELNRIFIDIYGLADELTPEVEDKDVTVRRADLPRDIRSLISYAVGCMFGRYSLDTPGLVYAGGTWDDSKYTTFLPDEDAIIPICDDEYFDDDIVGRFVEFIATVFGKETLEENLQFIADALGGRGSSREVIRSYFLTGFYADHVKTYQKRPIYWLFDSGKKNGFKCLVYMHRYCPDTIARIRTDYVHEQQSRYRTAIESLEQARDNAATAGDKVKAGKKLAVVEAQAKELLEYEEKIHHLADQMIAIDLDDGVKHNYAIFQDVLAKIK